METLGSIVEWDRNGWCYLCLVIAVNVASLEGKNPIVDYLMVLVGNFDEVVELEEESI